MADERSSSGVGRQASLIQRGEPLAHEQQVSELVVDARR